MGSGFKFFSFFNIEPENFNPATAIVGRCTKAKLFISLLKQPLGFVSTVKLCNTCVFGSNF